MGLGFRVGVRVRVRVGLELWLGSGFGLGLGYLVRALALLSCLARVPPRLLVQPLHLAKGWGG